jgi:hypothetical protein
MPWEFVEINEFLRVQLLITGLPTPEKRDNRANQTEKYAQPSYSLNSGHKILRCHDG